MIDRVSSIAQGSDTRSGLSIAFNRILVSRASTSFTRLDQVGHRFIDLCFLVSLEHSVLNSTIMPDNVIGLTKLFVLARLRHMSGRERSRAASISIQRHKVEHKGLYRVPRCILCAALRTVLHLALLHAAERSQGAQAIGLNDQQCANGR